MWRISLEDHSRYLTNAFSINLNNINLKNSTNDARVLIFDRKVTKYSVDKLNSRQRHN